MVRVDKVEPRGDGIHIFINSNGFDFELVTEKVGKGKGPNELFQRAYDASMQIIEGEVRKKIVLDHQLPPVEDRLAAIGIRSYYVLITPGVETKVELKCVSISEWGVEEDISDKVVFYLDGKRIDGNTFTVDKVGFINVEARYQESKNNRGYSCVSPFYVEDVADAEMASDEAILSAEEALEKNLETLLYIESRVMEPALFIDIIDTLSVAIDSPNKKLALPDNYNEIVKAMELPLIEIQHIKEFLRQERIKRNRRNIPWPVKKNKNKEDTTNG